MSESILFPKLPFDLKYSFNPLIQELKAETHHIKEITTFLDKVFDEIPLIAKTVDTIEEFEAIANQVEPLIEVILPKPLMKNNLKAIGFPISDKFLYPTEALKEIIETNTTTLKSRLISLNQDDIYKITCCVILSRYYKINLNFDHTNLLEIDNGKGFMTYLSVTYDLDYFYIYPSSPEFELTEDQIEELLNNYEDTELWYSYFPEKSWIGEGFMLASFFDNTANIAISNLKSNLLSYNDNSEQIRKETVSALKSIFKLNDLEIGFSNFNAENDKLEDYTIHKPMESLILSNQTTLSVNQIFCTNLIEKINQSDYYVISSVSKFVEKYPNDELIKILATKNIESFVLYPLKKNNQCLGILEIASKIPSAFNRINAFQLKEILPLIEDTIYRYTLETELQINSFIQTEYTSLHPSVEWKFINLAKENLANNSESTKKSKISFVDVYPFYGEIDVRNSSSIRNRCLKSDYQNQIKYLIQICEEFYHRSKNEIFQEYINQLNRFYERIDLVDKIFFEQELFEYISYTIHPEIPKYVQENEQSIVNDYLSKLDSYTGLFYVERKKFDDSIAMLNQSLATKLDVLQMDAQKEIPHYYERFKTDGIDYNLYVGKSINPKSDFNYDLVQEIRFWQLQAMILLEQSYKKLRQEMPISLDVASLILATNSALDITFKLDEKRFDVDGYNNAKYEIIKKRINKAFVKNSNERINVPGKLCIIYYEEVLKDEYINYLNLLINQGFLEDNIEFLEVEELQGLSGLLAIRVGFNYTNLIEHYQKFNL